MAKKEVVDLLLIKPFTAPNLRSHLIYEFFYLANSNFFTITLMKADVPMLASM